MNTYVIAGLGNPGPKYQWTRHNAGFLFLDRLAHHENLVITRSSFSGLAGEWKYRDSRLILLKPQTFMNLSGRSVMQALQFYKLPLTSLIVVHDELDLPFENTTRFLDLEGPGQLVLDPVAVARAYREELRAYVEKLSRGAGLLGIPYALVTSAGDPAPALGRLLRRLRRR